MRRSIVVSVIVVLALAGLLLYNRSTDTQARMSGQAGPGGAQMGRGGPGGPGGRGMGMMGPRAPMPVEFATVERKSVAETVTVVGNLIGAATVEVVPKVSGRLQAVNVRMGDPVRRGQLIAKVEDSEIQEQVRQAEASFEVARASVRQREADLKLAQTNLERSRSLFERQLLPSQTFDDVEARYQAALAQLDLARAQFDQARARLDELKITLGNTTIISPVEGFVASRYLDPGAFVGTNAPVASVVDIRYVRLVANLVERDSSRVRVGAPATVEVDAFPGETFNGKVSRVAPVFDPATRTAEMEIEVPNPGGRLKPGMYARVQLTVGARDNALTVPRNAIVAVNGSNGVFVEGAPPEDAEGPDVRTAKFQAVEIGIRDGERVEIVGGIAEGVRVITTGAGALRDGDRIVLADARDRAPGGGPLPAARGASPGQGRPGQGQERNR